MTTTFCFRQGGVPFAHVILSSCWALNYGQKVAARAFCEKVESRWDSRESVFVLLFGLITWLGRRPLAQV